MSDLLSTQDAALILRVGVATVRDYEKRGLLPAVRTGSGWRLFLREDVEKLAPCVPLPRGRKASK